jgi:zinc protease
MTKLQRLFFAITIGVLGCSGAVPKAVEPVFEDRGLDDSDRTELDSWRTAQPEAGPTPRIVVPEFEKATLDNGLTIIISRRSTLPIASFSFVLKSGSGRESKKKEGLADLTYETMLEGTGKMDGVAVAEAFADLGTKIFAYTTKDGASFQATVLKRHLPASMALMADIIRRPAFRKRDFVRKQKERIADLVHLMGDARYLSQVGIHREIYSDGHPYGHPKMGHRETVEKFNLTDIKRFYKKNVGPEESAIVISGDVNLKDVVALSKEYFGDWNHKPNPREVTIPITTGVPLRVAYFPKIGLNQTVIAFGRQAVRAGSEEEWALRLAVEIFGGMFGSRLNMNLREDKGYTYGARAHLSAGYLDGAIIASTSVRADVTGKALEEAIYELKGITERPITQTEFDIAKNNVLKSVSGWFESVDGLTRAGGRIFTNGLPLDRYEIMLRGYRELSLEHVRRAAGDYLRYSDIKLLLVGDPDIIEKQVPSLNIGEIVDVKSEGMGRSN